MKLHVFLTPPLLTIFEGPEMGPDQPLGLNNPEILNELEPTGQNIEGVDLYAKKFGDQIIFALKTDVVLTFLIGTELSDFPSKIKKPTIVIGRTWTNPKVGEKGTPPLLLMVLVRLDIEFYLIDNCQKMHLRYGINYHRKEI